jgi:hypothetical protein
MGDLVEMLEVGETGQTGGKLGEGRVHGGLRVGSRTHFSVGHLEESGSLKRQVLEILVCLGWGLDNSWCLIGKWKSGFIRGLGMKGLGWWMEGWGFGSLRFGFGDWGRAAPGRKNWEILIGEKGSRNALWANDFRVGFWDLPKAS